MENYKLMKGSVNVIKSDDTSTVESFVWKSMNQRSCEIAISVPCKASWIPR